MKPSTPQEPMREILGRGPYRSYTIGNGISLVGTWMQRITVGYLTWELTQSATWLGLMSVADLFPTVLVSPLAGVLADRWNRHAILMAMQALGLVQAGAMVVLYELGWLTIWPMLGFTLVLGIVNAVAQPARLAMISTLVPRHAMGAAVAVNAVNFNMARFAGPAVAGALISTVGVGWAFAANALSYAAFLRVLVRMPPAIRRRPAPQATQHFLKELACGLDHVLRHRGTGLVMLLLLVTGICSRPVIELLPGFAQAVFDRGPGGLSMLTAAIGVGAMAGGLWMARRRGGRPQSRLMVDMALGGSVLVGLFANTSSLWLALPLLAGAGLCWTCTSIAAQTLLQTGVPDEMRGRVLSFYGLIVRSAPAIGALTIGMASDRLGLQPAVMGAAVLASAYAVFQYTRVARIRADLEADPGEGRAGSD